MTSKNVVFDPNKLEKLLIKNWADFINPRELLSFIRNNVEQKFNITNPKIQTLLISNCEFDNNGLFLWISYKILKSNETVNSTTKVFLNQDGTITEIKTIEI